MTSRPPEHTGLLEWLASGMIFVSTSGEAARTPTEGVAIATARQAQEMVARFVSCLVFHVNSGGTQEAKAMWSAEVRQAAQQVATWGWSDAAVDDSLIRPVQDEMVVRFGPAEGLQLFFDFVAVFYGS